jgi:hypothetical protein
MRAVSAGARAERIILVPGERTASAARSKTFRLIGGIFAQDARTAHIARTDECHRAKRLSSGPTWP